MPPPQVAAPDLTIVGLEANRGALFSEHLAQQLTALGFTVVTAKQISSLLGKERQKQLMGCNDESSSCMAELAAALGSDAIITGSVAKLSEGAYQVNISIVSAIDGKPMTVLSTREARLDGGHLIGPLLARPEVLFAGETVVGGYVTAPTVSVNPRPAACRPDRYGLNFQQLLRHPAPDGGALARPWLLAQLEDVAARLPFEQLMARGRFYVFTGTVFLDPAYSFRTPRINLANRFTGRTVAPMFCWREADGGCSVE